MWGCSTSKVGPSLAGCAYSDGLLLGTCGLEAYMLYIYIGPTAD